MLPVKDALLCRIKGSGGEAGSLPVLFTGHMDVVAAKDSDGWDYPPFSGTVTADSVWGRGSQDMKDLSAPFFQPLTGDLKQAGGQCGMSGSTFPATKRLAVL